jgi:hypothetical protein
MRDYWYDGGWWLWSIPLVAILLAVVWLIARSARTRPVVTTGQQDLYTRTPGTGSSDVRPDEVGPHAG